MQRHLTEKDVGQILTLVEARFPGAYGYTDPDSMSGLVWRYLIFRSREESFDKSKAIVSVSYAMFPSGSL